MVDDPADHKASRHRARMGVEPPRFADVTAALATFGENAQEVRRRYSAALRLVCRGEMAASRTLETIHEIHWTCT
jgi:hypothetical protein